MTNKERATLAAKAIEMCDGSVRDLIANIHHYCDQNGIDFVGEMVAGINHFSFEKLEEQS